MALQFQRTALGVLMSISAGGLMAGAVYLWEAPWLALVAWVPAILAQHLVLPARVNSIAPALAWFGYLSLAVVPALTPDLGPWVLLLPVGIALISGALERKTVAEQSAAGYHHFWWSSAATSTAVEFGRTFIPAQGTWSLVGYGLVPADGWLSAAGFVGLLGLCFMVWACNFALAQVVLVWAGRAQRQTWSYRGALVLVAGAVLVTLLPSAAATGAGRSIRVAAIQVGVDPDLDPAYASWSAARWTEHWLEIGAEQTRRAAEAGARIVVWPEGFLRMDPGQHPALRDRLHQLAQETQVSLVVGYVVAELDGRRNEAALVTPDGQWHVTEKDHPVPWAETGTSAGNAFTIAEVDGVKVGVMICYDADFTDTMRERARMGAEVVVAPAHDWQAMAAARLRHLRLRAGENRAPIVMADWSVGSTAVGADGKVLARAPLNELVATQVVVDVPAGAGGAPYSSAGDLAGWAAVGLFPVGIRLTGRAVRRQQQERKAA